MNILNVGYDSTNYYLVEQNNTRLLVDVGFPGTLPKLLALLKRKGVSLQAIDYLFTTHYHPDHAGLVQELKNQGLKHILLEEQRPFVAQLKGYVKANSGFIELAPQSSICFPTQQSRAWLATIGLQGEFVPTPGHSEDSISLVLDEGVAFTGDLAPPFMADESNASIIGESWDRLRRLGVSRIYPGHGPERLPMV